VAIRTYACHRQANPGTHHYLKSTEDAVLQGQAVLRAVHGLLQEGFQPRLVVTHAGSGIGLFLKDLLPSAVHVGYFEWFFRPETACHLLESFDLDAQLLVGMRNLPILQELEVCDVAVVPTEWQKSQFPKAYQTKLQVIFDGIDRSFFHPEPASSRVADRNLVLTNRDTGTGHTIPAQAPVLSYATRGMEPLRGFPEFLQAAAHLLSELPELHVVIAGADRRAYSYEAPTHHGSWKEHTLAKLGTFDGQNRLHFTGLLTYGDYRHLLWRSSLHCYFTRPYVTSWSLFEAAACAARLTANPCAATAGIAAEGTVLWVDFDDHASLIKELKRGLNDERPRARLLPGYELGDCLQKWEKLVNAALST
jgi:glycosyltransferase involved in cell wall biosynthesis